MSTRCIAIVSLLLFVLASPAGAATMSFSDPAFFTDEGALDGISATVDGIQIDIATQVFFDGDAPGPAPDLSTFGTVAEFFSAEFTSTLGGDPGHAFLGFDSRQNDLDDFLEIVFTFSSAVLDLTFSLLDIDSRAQGGASDFTDGVIVTYNGGINIIGDPTLYTLGSQVIVGNEGLGEFEGIPIPGTNDAVPSASSAGNLDIDFGSIAVTEFTIRYFSTSDAPANPSGQILGISDLVFSVPEPGTGLLLAAGFAMLLVRRSTPR